MEHTQVKAVCYDANQWKHTQGNGRVFLATNASGSTQGDNETAATPVRAPQAAAARPPPPLRGAPRRKCQDVVSTRGCHIVVVVVVVVVRH